MPIRVLDAEFARWRRLERLERTLRAVALVAGAVTLAVFTHAILTILN